MFTRSTHRVEFVNTDALADPFPSFLPDEPLITAEDAMAWPGRLQSGLLLFATFCAGMAARHFFF